MSPLRETAHFIKFHLPGDVVPTTLSPRIPSWDIPTAITLADARAILRPYAFQFVTLGRDHHALERREMAASQMYYLGGTVMDLEELRDMGTPLAVELAETMAKHNFTHVIRTRDGKLRLLPPDAVVLDYVAPDDHHKESHQ